ncbi:hypothetical protein T01_13519 [Trichinella spiralis]|uniref:Uncharacterized protein n=1 Tax=Trichinella spiralis TaxID=6334 RepID=A0A0V1BWF1_TRISP|nr:hypothetical protein T01_13519 [Trichinella spiralis]
MTFSRFSVEPIVPTFQVVIGSDIYITCIQIGSRSSVIHSCRKYRNRAAKVPVVPVSSSLTLVSISVPAHRLSYVLPGRSGSSSPVPAYSGSSPESRVSGLFQNHR